MIHFLAVLVLALCGVEAGLAVPAGAVVEHPPWLEFQQRSGSETAIPPGVRSLDEARRAELAQGGHPYVELLRRYSVSLRPGGELDERIVVVRHLLNETGVREHGNLSYWVRPQSARLIVEEAWVRLPDGHITDLEPETLQILSDSDPDVFSDSRQVVFPFSKLETGATLHLALRFENRTDRWPLPWSRLYHPQSLVPIESFEVLVSWDESDPSSRPHWASDDPALRCSEATAVLTCSRRRIPPVPFDPEVAWVDELPHLSIGAAHGWPELVQPLGALVEEAAARDDGVEDLAERLDLAGRPDRERLARIQRFVADRVRYAGFEHGTNAVVPHPASTTLARRYGDCKDKVTLFLALAHRSGLEAWPVLVATDRFAPEKLITPAWRYFDHMIACVRIDEEPRPVCVDLTDPHADVGALPLWLQGAVALDLRPDVAAPHALPAAEHAWRIEIEAVNELACDGSLVEALERRFVGSSAGVVRHQVAPLNAGDRRRWLEDGYAEVMGEQVEPEFELSGAEGSGAALKLRSTTRFGGTSPVQSLTHWAEQDAWLVHYAHQFRTQNQHHPYRMTGLHLTAHNRYHLCPEVRIGLTGAELAFVSDVGSLVRRYERDGDQALTVVTELRLPRREVPPQELDPFNGFLDRVLAETRIWFSIEPAGEARR